jgi:hypothetical protein
MREVEWTSFHHPRLAERGIETVFHHPLILLRRTRESSIEVARPIDVIAESGSPGFEWSPMPWATPGRRAWRTYGHLTPASTFAGDDGHIFHSINAVCEQLFEGGRLSDAGLEAWVRQLEHRAAWCEARGIAYRHLVIPEHHSIYPDKLPGMPALAADRPLLRIRARLSQQVRDAVIYPLTAMIAGRTRHETSLPHDVHFTAYGSFLCYRELMRTLPHCAPERILDEGDLVPREIFVAGDVARAFGAPGRKVEWHEPPKEPVHTVLKGTSFRTNQVDVFRTEHSALPRLVLFRTSNSTLLMPFLFRHFSRVVAVASGRMFFDLVESEAPDVVLTEIPERYIAGSAGVVLDGQDQTSLSSDAALESFEDMTCVSLPLPVGEGPAGVADCQIATPRDAANR